MLNFGIGRGFVISLNASKSADVNLRCVLIGKMTYSSIVCIPGGISKAFVLR